MRKFFAAFAVAVSALAQPAVAVTFPSLTTIYVGSGVYDDGGGPAVGEATTINCSNVSGVAVQVRALVLNKTGAVAGSLSVTLVHGATFTFTTHVTLVFGAASGNLNTGAVVQGVVNVESTNSGVFCTALLVDAENFKPVYMSSLHLVRVNPHPGTVE